MLTKMKRLSVACLMASVSAVAMADTTGTMDTSKRATARELAGLLNDATFTSTLSQALENAPRSHRRASIATPLRPLLTKFGASGGALEKRQVLQDIELNALQAKGTEANSLGLFEVRMYLPAGQAMPTQMNQLMVAFEPAGDEASWTAIEAFDAQGRVHTFDPKAKPDFPVLIVDVDGKEDMRAGVEVMNRVLGEHGMQDASDAVGVLAAGGGNELTVMEKVYVTDDEEPFVSGDADSYAIESGINTDGNKPRIVIHDMPWLDNSETTYYPGQHVVFWNNHALGVANLQFMEQDDNTDWGAKAKAVLSAVTTIVGPIKPEVAVVGAIGQAILQAFPDTALTNEDDYVDSFYLLERGKIYVDRPGARNNARATFVPRSLPSSMP